MQALTKPTISRYLSTAAETKNLVFLKSEKKLNLLGLIYNKPLLQLNKKNCKISKFL